MTAFEELRYPFQSLVEFIGGGYWLKLQALHLTLGWLFLIVFSFRVLLRRPGSPVYKLVALYFALAIFNNYAYVVGGIRINEALGTGAAILVLLALLRGAKVPRSPVVGYLLFFLLVSGVHSLLVVFVYPELNQGALTAVIRFALWSKAGVLALAIVGFLMTVDEKEKVDNFVAMVVTAGSAACVLYLVQMATYYSGTLPYGTFWDAGFTGVPSFGAVSIERGHFGKLLTPLFPFFLLHFIETRKIGPLLLFGLVSLLNFSASSLVYLAGYLALTVFFYSRRILFGRLHRGALATVLLGILLSVVFLPQYMGVFDKVIHYGLEGGKGGGRGWDILGDYLYSYPLGISYGGSTLRTVDGLPEINMGISAFVSQLSFLAVPLVIALVATAVLVLLRAQMRTNPVIRGALILGVLMAFFVWFVDVLWFVPMLWAPLMLLDWSSYCHLRRRQPVHLESSVRGSY